MNSDETGSVSSEQCRTSNSRASAGDPVAARWPRTGIGVDVHAWAQDDRVLHLAALEWPGERGIEGHSDGDVASHAVCDALFSACGLGDLGQHFGVDRPELAGASGARLLSETRDIVERAGYAILNVAVQIVGNRPKVGTRRDEAQQAMSAALGGVPVAISATTTDRLGFLGRGEGLAALATALVLPAA